MIKNKKIKIVLWFLEILFIGFQLVTMTVTLKDYYLIYDWIFYCINYVIIVIPNLIYRKNRYIRWSLLYIGLLLFIVNTTFFYYVGNTNTIVSTSPDSQGKLILKEYKNMDFETMALKEKAILFGKKTITLTGSSKYKTIQEKTYKIYWIDGNIAVLIYKPDDVDQLLQGVFTFRDSNYTHFQYVSAGLNGKWYDEKNTDNYFMYDKGEIVYAKDGQLYYYRSEDTDQVGDFALIVHGDKVKPSFTIILNSDCEFGEDNLIIKGGTITILPVKLDSVESNVYYREN
ncbi:MAG: hypothetical protein ACOWWR_08255 [Eubacteriales bacterium]